MSKNELQKWLLSNEGFLEKFNVLLKQSVVHQFPNLMIKTSETNKIDWRYMLMCASLLAQSDQEECQKIALRIAQFCIENDEATVPQKDAAAVILDTMANKPSIRLAEDRGLIPPNYIDRLPFTLLLDVVKRDIKNAVHLFDEEFLTVNSFQREFWKQVNDNTWLSISAPTSAGKSFIIEQWIVYYLRYYPNATIVYIVPTRALISQVQRELERTFAKYKFNKYMVSTLPIQSAIKDNTANILVYTQERFQILLSDSNSHIDLLIIDEAHKLGDAYRGVLLQHAVDTAVTKNPSCKVIYASPMTSNPEILLDDSPDKVSKVAMTSECITVSQNLIWISPVSGRPKEWSLLLITENARQPMGDIVLSESPDTKLKKRALIAYSICGLTSGNVIYANGAADAEKIAKLLYSLIPDVESVDDIKEIKDLIELVKKVVHKEYLLSMYLKKGIAFHYGNIPLIIRNEIERLFDIGLIKYLICTSTLVEGVNLPCRNLFLHGPQKGHNNPMNETDFWNLAGRAGRWGKEFQGNIFCIEAEKESVWRNGPPSTRKKYPIIKTADQVIRNADFLDYLDALAESNEPDQNSKFEYVLSYLTSNIIRNGKIGTNNWIDRFGTTKVDEIQNAVIKVLNNIKVSKETILNNPGVSPYSMNKLYEYFETRTLIDQRPVEELLPAKPESEDAYKQYIKILNRINRHLAKGIFGYGGRVNYLALLIINWMSGYSLARIIAERENYEKGKNLNYNLHTLIRETMQDVEEVARFQAPKYLSCYLDVLKCFLNNHGKQDLLGDISDMHILLEFGVANKTQLSLIGIGLSRPSCVEISQIIPFDSLDEESAISWLKENKWMTEDMPELIKAEVNDVLSRKGI